MKRSLKHRILVMVILGLLAAVISSGVVYAALVQWGKEVPATAVRVQATALPENAVLLFHDAGLTEPLMNLEFLIEKWLPPLDEVLWRGDSTPVWIKNNSQVELVLVSPQHEVWITVDGVEFPVGRVYLRLPPIELPWPDERILKPGEVLSTRVMFVIYPGAPAPDTFNFHVIFGAVGGIAPELIQMRPMTEQPPGGE